LSKDFFGFNLLLLVPETLREQRHARDGRRKDAKKKRKKNLENKTSAH
jgi:hypothetical protein